MFKLYMYIPWKVWSISSINNRLLLFLFSWYSCSFFYINLFVCLFVFGWGCILFVWFCVCACSVVTFNCLFFFCFIEHIRIWWEESTRCTSIRILLQSIERPLLLIIIIIEVNGTKRLFIGILSPIYIYFPLT